MRSVKRQSAPNGLDPSPQPLPVEDVPEVTPARRHPGREWRARAILDDPVTAGVLHAVWSGDSLTVVPSPPGAGKTRLVALLAATLADRAELRVGVAAQTRDQAVEIARRVGRLTGSARLGWASSGPAPDVGERSVAVARGGSVAFPSTAGGVVIATTAKWLASNPDRLGCDVMLVDEAWQATYADVGALGAFAAQIVCVGDPGQIDPVVTGPTGRWDGSPSGPHLSAPDALTAAHPGVVTTLRMRHTWRLGPETTAMIQPAFYPSLPFTSKRPPEHITAGGARLPEVRAVTLPVTGGPTDPVLVGALADSARALLGTRLHTAEGERTVEPTDLAVVCPHVAQTAAVRAMLADLPDVLVGTANAVQGMERAAAVVAHPLAGYRDVTAFGTDTGRACVMLSRHRAHLTVVADSETPHVLADADPEAGGVQAHRHLWDALTR